MFTFYIRNMTQLLSIDKGVANVMIHVTLIGYLVSETLWMNLGVYIFFIKQLHRHLLFKFQP